MYEIRHAGAKGFGLFATQRIARGTRILAERPVLTVKSERDVYRAAKRLSSDDRHGLMQLSVSGNKAASILGWMEAASHVLSATLIRPSEKGEPGASKTPSRISVTDYMSLLAIFRNNNFDIGNDTQAVFRNISRTNHSCVPNAQGNFNSAINSFTLHAVRSIDETEEITLSYLDEHGATRDARQAHLMRGYGFHCDCPACSLDSVAGQEGEQRRTEVRERLRSYAHDAAERDHPDHAAELGLMKEMIRIFEDEGIAGRELGTTYLAAAETNVKVGDRSEAQHCARLGLEYEEVCLGSDNPLYQDSMKRMSRIGLI